MSFSRILKNIAAKKARVGIVGIGYVGTALAQANAANGFTTIGFDINPGRVEQINASGQKNLTASSDFSRLAECDIICICVPTPLYPDSKPNLSQLESAAQTIADYLQPGQLVILESSVAPGTTRNILMPILEKSGLTAGRDFFLSFSPERIDPKNEKHSFKSIPKVVSGLNHFSLSLARSYYQKLVDRVVPVSSLEAAELTKVLENTFRLVNISFINEMATYAKTLKLNIWEIIEAANTKPFGFLAHYPGPGAGGYCIPVLPYYLYHHARSHSLQLPLVKTAININEAQPEKIAQLATQIISKKAGNLKRKVLMVGLSYKPEVGDPRESAAVKVWEALDRRKFDVAYHDPYIPKYNGTTSVEVTPQTLTVFDLIIITTAHKNIAYAQLVSSHIPVIDTRNVLRKFPDKHIYRL